MYPISGMRTSSLLVLRSDMSLERFPSSIVRMIERLTQDVKESHTIGWKCLKLSCFWKWNSGVSSSLMSGVLVVFIFLLDWRHSYCSCLLTIHSKKKSHKTYCEYELAFPSLCVALELLRRSKTLFIASFTIPLASSSWCSSFPPFDASTWYNQQNKSEKHFRKLELRQFYCETIQIVE